MESIMGNAKWLHRSENLYIMKEIWKLFSGRPMTEYYKLLGIKDSDYSAFMKHEEQNAIATRKIEKQKDKIVKAGFDYKWFTGDIILNDQFSEVDDKQWYNFFEEADSDKGIEKEIGKYVAAVYGDYGKVLEYYKVYKVVTRYNPNRVANELRKYIEDIDTSKLLEEEIDNILKLEETMEEFLADIKAIKRCLQIQKRTKNKTK